MSTTTLVCSCGMTLNAAGAKPGRVGKCPKCGSLLRVPDDFIEPASERPKVDRIDDAQPPGYAVDHSASAGRASFYQSPTLDVAAPRRSKRRLSIPTDHGPVQPPKSLETRFRESLTYPLWSWSSIAILGFMPPVLAIVSAPVTFLAGLFFSLTSLSIAALILLIPSMILGLFVWGYILVFLGHVLTTSAFGEPLPPRSPHFQDDDLFRVLGRWFWAIFAGVGLGVAPAVAYWIECGEVDWADRLMFANLFALGAAYGQMALLAALLHDDPLAANPITVGRALIRLGWDYAAISLLSGAFAVTMISLLGLLTTVENPLLSPILIWLYWVALLYGSMVVLRRLGLFCHRHRVLLAWFQERPTWGR